MRSLIVYSSVICFIFSSCQQQNNVRIKAEKEIISYGELYKAELSVEYSDTILPSFHLIVENDTINLPFYEESGNAVFQLIGGKFGKREFNGFVDYVDKNGTSMHEVYTIKLRVKGNNKPVP